MFLGQQFWSQVATLALVEPLRSRLPEKGLTLQLTTFLLSGNP